MVGKTAFGVLVLGCVLAACAGPGGKGEGDSCSTQDDCSADLTCQPVDGRSGDYCCPAPAEQSDKSNCHATTPSGSGSGGGSGSGSGSSSGSSSSSTDGG